MLQREPRFVHAKTQLSSVQPSVQVASAAQLALPPASAPLQLASSAHVMLQPEQSTSQSRSHVHVREHITGELFGPVVVFMGASPGSSTESRPKNTLHPLTVSNIRMITHFILP